MRKSGILHIASTLIILVFCTMFVFPQSAYAGHAITNNGYTPGNSMSGAIAKRMFWYVENNGSTYKRFDAPGTQYSYNYPESGPTLQQYTNNYTRLIAYTASKALRNGKVGGQINFIMDSDHNGKGCIWNSLGNWGLVNPEPWFPSELRDPSLTGVNIEFRNDIANRRSIAYANGSKLVAVWVDPNLEWSPKEESSSGTFLVKMKTTNGEGDFSKPYGTQEQLKTIYKSGQTEAQYHNKTKPNSKSDKFVVETTVVGIKEVHKWDQKPDGSTKNHRYEYHLTSTNNYKKTINYSSNSPTISQTKYRPINLNRNGYATRSDIDSSFANASTGINADVNNNRGITDNKAIESLDTNTDTKFYFKFKNDCFGMPSNLKWYNNPSSLANGTYEVVNHNLGYANGKNNNADHDGFLRYNLSFYGSIGSNSKNPSISSSSIVFNNKEYLANEVIKGNSQNRITLGDLSSKFTFVDQYTTDNNQSGSKFKDWWINKYSMGRFYEYGTEYWGKVNSSGIENPYKVSYGTGSSSGNDYNITTNVNINQRGLYIDYASQSFEQPVFYGKFDVNTLAGDIN